MRTRTIWLGILLAGAGAGIWFLWSSGGGETPTDVANTTIAQPVQSVESASLAAAAAAAPGADAAETKELPPPLVVEEGPGPRPRELARDEPRETKWGSLTLRPADEEKGAGLPAPR